MSLREKKTAKKKEDILHSAIMIFSKKGYYVTTMEDIASELYMTKGSIYYYFKNKEEVVYECHKMILGKGIENMENIVNKDLLVAEKLKQAMTFHIEVAIDEKEGFSTMFEPEKILSGKYLKETIKLRDQYASYFDRLISEGIDKKVFIPLDVKMARMVILGSMNWVNQWYSPVGEKDKSQIAETISDHLLKMLSIR